MTSAARGGFVPWIGLLAAVVGGCTQTPAPDVVIIGASHVRIENGQRIHFFDGEATPAVLLDNRQPLQLAWDRQDTTFTATRTVDGGILYRVRRPTGTSSTSVSNATLTVRQGGAAWAAAVRFRPSPFRNPRIAAIRAAADKDPAVARRQLDRLPDDLWPTGCLEIARRVAVEDRAEAHVACGRGGAQRGFVSEPLVRRLAATFWSVSAHRLTETSAHIDEARALLKGQTDPDPIAWTEYLHAYLLLQLGRHREALRGSKIANHAANRADNAMLQRLVQLQIAGIRSELGQHAEALRVATEVRPVPAPPTRNAAIERLNIGWVQLRAYEATPTPALFAAAQSDLERADAMFTALGLTADAVNARSSLANLHLIAAQHSQAAQYIAKARQSASPELSIETLYLDLIEGELALALSEYSKAETLFNAVLKAARLESPEAAIDYRWRARLHLAELNLLLGDEDKAFKQIGLARGLLARMAYMAAPIEERSAFLGDRRSVVARTLRTLVQRAQVDVAWRLADEAQAILLRNLEQDRSVRLNRLSSAAQAEYEAAELKYFEARATFLADQPPRLVSVDDLQAWRTRRQAQAEALEHMRTALASRLRALDPQPVSPAFEPQRLDKKSALLEIFHHRDDTWAFWVTQAGVSGFARAPTDLLTPARLAGLANLYVVTGGWADGALPVLAHVIKGEPLVAQAQVSLVPFADFLARDRLPVEGRALVVADPERNLPFAREEGEYVARSFDGELLMREQADLASVIERLDGRRLFHFAGHGDISPEAPWDAHLRLAKGQRLDFELLLVRRPQIGLAVLTGCETGRPSNAPTDGVGLAEAFLLGGTRFVLATTTEVEDEASSRFVRAFYKHGGAHDPQAGFQRAAAAARAAGDPIWRAFRLFGR